jgi:hypothetical protein
MSNLGVKQWISKMPKLILVIIVLALIAIIISFVLLMTSNHNQGEINKSRDVKIAEIQKGILNGQILISGKVTLKDTLCKNMTVTPIGNPPGSDNFTVDSDGSFLATVIPNRSVLLVANNSKHQACLEAVGFPTEDNTSTTIDIASTTVASAFPVDSGRISSDIQKITNLSSYTPIKDFLSTNLKKKTLGDISQDSQYTKLFDTYNQDVINTLK